MRAVLRSIAAGLVASLALLAMPAVSQSPPATLTQPGSPVQPAPGGTRPTLIPEAGDPGNVDEVELPAKPVLVFAGSSDWDEGLKNVKAAFARIETELVRLKIAPAGRPIVLYTQTGDDNFKFDAMIPVASAPAAVPSDLAKDMRFGTTPAGKAWRFVHKGPYDDVDSTYETITTYLEAKDIVAKDAFLEEFANDPADGTDANLELNIFVQPK